MGRHRRLERGQEGAQAPDTAEVVRTGHLLDSLGIEAEEAAAPRDARVVHEQLDRRMALANRARDPLDRRPVADVARLPLGSELPGDCAQALLAAGDQDAAPALLGQLAGDRGSDPARAACDDRYLRHTRTTRSAVARAPRRSTTTARRRWRPRCASRVFHWAA